MVGNEGERDRSYGDEIYDLNEVWHQNNRLLPS